MTVGNFQYEMDGYTLTGTYEYEEPLAQTETDPAWGPVCTIFEIYVNGAKENAIELIDPAVIHSIEESLIRYREDWK